MDIKTSFFDVLPEVQKNLEDVSAGIVFFNMVQNNFAGNLT
jgi:hypothetical protein